MSLRFHLMLPTDHGTFSVLSRKCFWNLESLSDLESLQGRVNNIYHTLWIDFDSSALKNSLNSLCFNSFAMSYQAVAFHQSWVNWYSHKLWSLWPWVVCRNYWYLLHAIISLLPTKLIVLLATPLWMIYFTRGCTSWIFFLIILPISTMPPVPFAKLFRE